MSPETPRNLAASVRQRLFNRAQERHEDFGLVLTKYGLERFLHRLARSQYRDQFVLKGALLFELWTHHPYRPTRDLDLEGRGDNSITRIKQVFAEIIGQPVEDDGLIFDPKSMRVARIKERTRVRRTPYQLHCALGARQDSHAGRCGLRRHHRSASDDLLKNFDVFAES